MDDSRPQRLDDHPDVPVGEAMTDRPLECLPCGGSHLERYSATIADIHGRSCVLLDTKMAMFILDVKSGAKRRGKTGGRRVLMAVGVAVESTAIESAGKVRWRIALLLGAAIAISYLDRQTLSVAIASIQKEIPISNTQFSQLTSAFLLTYGAMYAGGGKLIDVLGTRRGFAAIMSSNEALPRELVLPRRLGLHQPFDEEIPPPAHHGRRRVRDEIGSDQRAFGENGLVQLLGFREIGRASCRERV